jgi:hypothetical protein
MNFNDHWNLEGQHAFLSASKYHWINYDDEKLALAFSKYMAAQKGTEMHDLAKRLIELGVKLPKSKKTINMYVNDAIGFQMQPEILLYYSDNCFGTCDCISFKKNFLRIHDLKNGESPTSIKQVRVYAALFCLEYRINPADIDMELRIYQLDNIVIDIPDPEEILNIMNTIIRHDQIIEKIKIGG